MADEIRKINARIGGVSYQLVTAENEIYTRQIAAKADEMISRVLQDGPQLSQQMATILALVNAVDELAHAYQQIKTLDVQKLETERKSEEARKELARLREQAWEMKKELLQQKETCREYQSLIEKLTRPVIPTVEDPEQQPELDEPIADAALARVTEPIVPRGESVEATHQTLHQTNLDDYLLDCSRTQASADTKPHGG